jgi:hypothetical protein
VTAERMLILLALLNLAILVAEILFNTMSGLFSLF